MKISHGNVFVIPVCPDNNEINYSLFDTFQILINNIPNFSHQDLIFPTLRKNPLYLFDLKAFICMHKENLICFFKVNKIDSCVAELNAVFSTYSYKLFENFADFKSFLIVAKRLITFLHHDSYARLEARIDPARKKDVNFVKYLGFQFDANLKSYGPNGEPYQLWSHLSPVHSDPELDPTLDA
jgi:hypothetical protein